MFGHKSLISTILFILISAQVATAQDSADIKVQSRKKTRSQKTVIPDNDMHVFSPVHKHSIGIGLGQTMLSGDLRDNGENRITADFYYTYSASYSFDFLLNLHYSKHEIRQRSSSIPGLAASIKAKVFQYDQFSPYVLGGLGFYRPRLVRTIGKGEIQETDGKFTFGTNFGAGVDLALNRKINMGILMHYHNPFDVNQDVGGKVEGSYFKLMITSMYTF